ncbi:MAG: hypothetical protein ACI9XO_002299 [Paraglaciecola sp.]|jgi:hypothetical protein
MSLQKNNHSEVTDIFANVRLPFALPIVQGKKLKKKCCKKFKKGKRCKRCPANLKLMK